MARLAECGPCPQGTGIGDKVTARGQRRGDDGETMTAWRQRCDDERSGGAGDDGVSTDDAAGRRAGRQISDGARAVGGGTSPPVGNQLVARDGTESYCRSRAETRTAGG